MSAARGGEVAPASGVGVAVAMSGGVDSSVTALLLRERGLRPVGFTLELDGQHRGGQGCSGAVEAARQAAAALGIPHHVVDGRARFEERVLRPAWRAYDTGCTPNPCVVCNLELKFGLLLEEARRHGLGLLATGHYARLGQGSDGHPRLLRGRDRHKDQSYFLFALTAEQLGSALFPLGELEKSEVRELARLHRLPAAERAESQDACLSTGADGFAEALRLRFGAAGRPGPLEWAADRRPLGRHAGIHRFTVGQRRGLGLALPRPGYVVGIDAARAAVLVGDEEALASAGLVAEGVSWFEPPRVGELELEVQIRYRHRAVPATIRVEADPTRVEVRFRQRQRAVTPGQAAVFYRGAELLGGGWIVAATSDSAPSLPAGSSAPEQV